MKPFDYIDINEARRNFARYGSEGATCFICLDGNEKDNPLLRDCSCRGDAGWAHFDCLAGYAKKKTEDLFDTRDRPYSPDELKDVWQLCINCKQEYQKNLSVAMSTECVEFIKGRPQYERKEWDTIETLKLKQMKHAFSVHLEEGKIVSKVILSLLEKSHPGTFRPHPHPRRRLLELTADTHRVLGYILSNIDGVDYYEEAIENQLKALKLYEELTKRFNRETYLPMIADSKRFIENAQQANAGRQPHKCSESELNHLQTMYEIEAKQIGEDNALNSGLNYVEALKKSGYSIKAQRLGSHMLKICQRIHGSNHALTKRALRSYVITHFRGMTFNENDYAFVKYNKKKDKYVVRGPLDLSNFKHMSDDIGGKSMVSSTACRLYDRTPVMIHGLVSPQEHLNGRIGENLGEDTLLGSVLGGTLRVVTYNIRFEDGEKVRIAPKNGCVVFDLPDGS